MQACKHLCVCVCTHVNVESSVPFSHSVMSNSLQPHVAACQSSLSITNSWSLPKPMSIESVMPPKHFILCRVPFSSCPQSFPASGSFQMSQPFASGGQSIGVSASTAVLPRKKQDRLELLAVQGTLKLSLLQHHSSKTSIL